jgi:hypothetical protein
MNHKTRRALVIGAAATGFVALVVLLGVVNFGGSAKREAEEAWIRQKYSANVSYHEPSKPKQENSASAKTPSGQSNQR